MKRPIQFMRNPAPADIAPDFLDFLRQLGGPTVIWIDGEERERLRALATLLHGNEPSGARALHRLLRSGLRPRVSLLCLIAAVQTALHEEPFRHRFMPGQRDLNRCFRAPFDDSPGHIARHFLDILEQRRPECLLDIHNTSAISPPFGVATHEDSAHESIVALFCHHLVITDLGLGALMEISGNPCPAVTVECGGARDPRSDRVAQGGLERYFLEADVLGASAVGKRLDLYHHPVRLELEAGTHIGWCEEPVAGMDLTVRSGLERYNFGVVDPNTPLAWLGPRGLDPLRVRNGRGEDVLREFFDARDGRLYPARNLKLFMVTDNPSIAGSDCLLYASPASEHTVIRVEKPP